MNSDEINYKLNERKITSQTSSEIIDEFNNIYKVKDLNILLMIKLLN